jgi:membrane protease YdiL (CAAX protease family)
MLRKQGLDTCLVPKKAFVFHLAVSLAMGFLGMFVYAAAVGKVQMLLSVASKLLTFSSLFLLVPVIVEEFVFREFLLARLTAGFGQHNGVFLSAMLFGLIHYPRHLLSSETSFLQATQVIVLIIAVSVGGGYGIYAIRCMFYGVFIHWGMNFIQASIQ